MLLPAALVVSGVGPADHRELSALAALLSAGVAFHAFAWPGPPGGRDARGIPRAQGPSVTAGLGLLLTAGLARAVLPPEAGLAALELLLLLLVTIAEARTALLLLVAGIVVAALTHPPGGSPAVDAGLVALFGGVGWGVGRIELQRARARARRTLDQDRRQAWEDARLYRLVSATQAGGTAAPWGDDRMLRSSVDEARHALFHALELLQRSLDLDGCVLFLLDDSGDVLRVAERVTSDRASEGAGDTLAGGPRTFPAGAGIFGAIVREERTVRLERVRPDYRGFPWVTGPCPIQSFLGIPVVEDGAVRGVLCADRRAPGGRPFGAEDEALLHRGAAQLLRVVHTERVLLQLERARAEQAILHRASQGLGAALDAPGVVAAAIAAAQEVVPHELRVLTRWDGTTRRHKVTRAEGEGAEQLEGLSFGAGPSLVSMVVANRFPLPHRGDFDGTQQILFTRKTTPRHFRSCLVLPLQVRDEVVGTMVLAARPRRAFGEGTRATLEALANQTAIALANAAAVGRLEELATTDGLTGCLNKRAFLEALDAKLKAASRFHRPLSLLVTDIDHFKKVNDTHGHAVGDVVIKELGGLLRSAKRDTDVVARFGGEEFCVLCEQTDADGARLLAERIREQLAARAFPVPEGVLRVTCSLGVATFPAHGQDPASLFEAADQALYRAKGAGRNRVEVAEALAIPARAG